MPAPRPIDHAAEMAQVDRMARLLDARFSLLGIRFGLDSILGLIPVVGDVAAAAPAGWMMWKAFSLGISRRAKIAMAVNFALDFGIGAIPLLGDIFDVAFKANLRNAALLRSELERMTREG
jgi:hypothetical protein